MKAKMIHKKWEKIISCLTATAIMLQLFLPLSLTAWAKEGQERTEETIIHAEEYGADPYESKDSAQAIQRAFEAAREAKEAGAAKVVVDFPKGEYHIYKDYAEKRE
ncbi:MAG: hypothetical protein HFI81_02805 [Eubacterium sp.]|nr:hypothetical protein [Eubacterium sp.]